MFGREKITTSVCDTSYVTDDWAIIFTGAICVHDTPMVRFADAVEKGTRAVRRLKLGVEGWFYPGLQ